MASQERIDAHHCHARGCKTKVPPEMLMCKAHWAMVPKSIQRRVWATYRPGQCDDMRPSEAWHEAADDAINAVALHEAEQLSFNKPCDHRWILNPGREFGGIMQLGRWVCVRCQFRGPDSRFKCPGKSALDEEKP